MARLIRRACLLLVVALSLTSIAASQHRPSPSARHADFERQITDELRARDPGAVELWQSAVAATERGDFAAALGGYRAVLARVSDFDHAVRRECSLLSQRRSHEQAIASCRRALALRDSGENRAALANALVASTLGSARRAPLVEARSHAEDAVARLPGDEYAWLVLLTVGEGMRDVAVVERAGGRLRELRPQSFVGWHAGAMALAASGDLDGAREMLESARSRGLPPAEDQRLSEVLDDARPLPARVLSAAVPWFVAWVSVFALLLLAGVVLSAVTLAATRDATGAEATRYESLVRRIYRLVLGATSLFFFASIPALAVVIALLGVGLFVLLLSVGHIPIKLLAVIAVVTLVTLLGLVQAARFVFVVRDDDPGLRLDPAEHPRLRALLDDVAAAVGTRPVDDVFVTAGTELAVFERGGPHTRLTGRSRRCLVLGVGVLDGFATWPLRAVLAHEYGHFANADTAGGDVALAVRRSVSVLAVSLIEGGVASWYNPAWWFVLGFNKVFLRVSHGASRLQEVLADRRAVQTYGSEAFVEGLRHVIERSVRFDHHVGATLKEVIDERRGLANLYGYSPATLPDAIAVQREIDEALSHAGSPYDSHPVPAERFARARAQAVTVAPPADAEEPAWSLLADREALERRLTDRVRDRISLEHGVFIPTEATPEGL